MNASPFHLFDVQGIEIEYMIVHSDTLKVCPVADELIKAAAGVYTDVTDRGVISWCNELVLHVIELKTTEPAQNPSEMMPYFQDEVRRINNILEPMGARLLPTAMHPWMNPATEMRLWPHDFSPIYQSFDRIFGCSGHGWANLQSTHLNLPFFGDAEFSTLHAAIRAALPLLPALSASSPVVDGRLNGVSCNRMLAYKDNAARIPSVSGRIIPDTYASEAEYRSKLLEPMYADIAPHDPERLLQEEWLNARGAIARFDRNAIEIRVLDVQEYPGADLAVLALATSLIKALCHRFDAVHTVPTDFLAALLWRTVEFGGLVIIENEPYLSALGINRSRVWVKDLWFELFERYGLAEFGGDAELTQRVRYLLEAGSLSRRISDALGDEPGPIKLFDVYLELSDCLQEGRFFGT